MRKLLITAMSAILLVALAGCKQNEDSSDSGSENSAPIESNNESADDSIDGEEGADNSGIEYPDNKAGRIVKAILAADEWSFMELADDETVGFIIPDLSADDCAEYCIAFCRMSGQLQYAVAVKPDEGSEKAVEDALTGFYNNIRNNPDAAFYPAEEAAAAGAVMDTTDDGYVVVIVHENGQTIGDVVYDVE